MSNLNYNHVSLGGRLCADPELKTTPSGTTTTSFNLAINKRAKEGAEPQSVFIRCVAWKQTAEFITRYFRRGAAIFVDGYIDTRSYTKDGATRYITEVVITKAYFVDSKADTGNAAPAANVGYNPYTAPAAPGQPYAAPVAPQFEEMGEDEELPF